MSEVSKQITHSFSREAFWLTKENESLFSWLYLPVTQSIRNVGFVLCPPLGHEYVHTYRTYRKLAETLAAQGIPVIRFDLHGAGNSNGDALAQNRLRVWQENIHEQINFLKTRTGVQHIGLFGVRIGATFALQACAKQTIDQLVIWRPIIKGKQYVRELTALSKFSSSSNQSEQPFIEAGGFVIAQQTLADLEAIDLAELTLNSRPKVLEITEVATASEKLKKIFPDAGRLESFHTKSYDAMMAEPQIAETPDDVIQEITSWVLNNSVVKKTKANPESAEMHPQSIGSSNILQDNFRESALFIRDRLFAILDEPTKIENDKKTIIILSNSGAVHTVGPNRLYVELTRKLVAHGYTTLRIDLHNIGDSVAGAVEKEGFPYPADAQTFRDIRDAVDYAKRHYPHHSITVGGVCSGSYWAFKAAAQIEKGLINRIVVINPLTFDWTSESKLEDPKDQGAVRDKIHYMNSAKNKEKWLKLLKGQVNFKKLFLAAFNLVALKLKGAALSALEIFGLLPTKKLVTDLLAIKSKGIDIHFIFSSLDPGFDLLIMSGGPKVKRMMGNRDFSVEFIKDADHTFSKQVHRNELLEKLLKQKL